MAIFVSILIRKLPIVMLRYILFFVTNVVIVFFCTGQGNTARRPNILWINVEDISPDLGCYGQSFATTPHLDSLARQSTLFTRAYATSPICTPSRTSFITGIYGTSMGTQHLRSDVKIPASVKPLPLLLKENGYWTSNYGKTDFNFSPEGFFDYWKQDLSPWRNNATGKPFFSMFVIGMTHEGGSNRSEQWAKATADLPAELFHDPETVPVPPYYPNTPEIRKSWAHYHDNITVMDRVVGEILRSLRNDRLDDNTIIFFFSDHGAGMPRYKRWLYNTGLHVPLLVYLPPQFRQNNPTAGTKDDRLVSLVDLVPSVLSLIGLPLPQTMMGTPFLGNQAQRRSLVFGSRDRADNMYEMSRSVFDGRFLYIKHFIPHYPYLQPGFIFSDEKESFRELRRLREWDRLPPESDEMWSVKPQEELYDLKSDPQELTNLADLEKYRQKADSLKRILYQWMVDTHDSGLVHEAEYMAESRNSTPWEYLQRSLKPNAKRILEVADRVGGSDVPGFTKALKDTDPRIRYWATMGIQAMGAQSSQASDALEMALDDPSPVVQITAAQTLCQWDVKQKALDVLAKWVADDRPWLALYAARSIELIGANATPLVPVCLEVLEKNRGAPGAALRYKDFNFAAFTTWSLEYALKNCGAPVPDRQE